MDVNNEDTNMYHIKTNNQIGTKDRYVYIMNFYFMAFFIALFISIIIILFGKIVFDVSLDLLNYYLFYTLLTIPLFIFSLNILIYLLPIVKFKANRDERSYEINFQTIAEEQKKPTMIKYLIRKIFLITFFVLGIISTLGNIILFIVEIII